ncbi:guanylate kinase [bacterium]|jgi:guanylate kinase|nr:guanylate kinase [bacterium]
MPRKRGALFVISAPSGAGKTTLINAAVTVLKKSGCNIDRAVTHTTRPIRHGEVHGKDYVFLSEEEFERQRANNGFLETSTYDRYHYGSPTSLIDDIERGKFWIVILDWKGALNVKKMFPEGILIWIEPPSIEILRDRLWTRSNPPLSEGRDPNRKEIFERRVEIARKEMEREAQNEYFHHKIINDDFDRAVESLVLILKLHTG